MSLQTSHWAVRLSERIYHGLMRAYPRAHREAFGGQMEQLFRDQCRDAWAGAHGWGMCKLWLGILPDWASTSMRERLAAFKRGRAMNHKLVNVSEVRVVSPITTFFTVLTVVCVGTFLCCAVITLLLPKTYAGVARLVDKDVMSRNPDSLQLWRTGSAEFDPYALQTTFERIQSEAVLAPVIERFHLIEVWGKEFRAGTPLSMDEAVVMLRHRLHLALTPGTQGIAIKVYSPDPLEAAQLANAVAESYQKYRQAAGLVEGSRPGNAGLAAARVEITDMAVPSQVPARPNRPLNFTMGLVLGLALGAMAGGVAVLVTSPRRKEPGMPVVAR